jgi:hypothetical protein
VRQPSPETISTLLRSKGKFQNVYPFILNKDRTKV